MHDPDCLSHQCLWESIFLSSLLTMARQKLASLLNEVLTAPSPDDDRSNPDWRLRRRRLDAAIWRVGWRVVENDSTAGHSYYETSPDESWVLVPPVTGSLDAAHLFADRVLGPSWDRTSVRSGSERGGATFRVRFHQRSDPDGGFEAIHSHEAMAVVAAVLGTLLVQQA